MRRLLILILTCLALLAGCSTETMDQGATTTPTDGTSTLSATTISTPTPSPTAVPTATPVPGTHEGYIDTEDNTGVNFRSQPSTDSDDTILGTLAEGTVIAIVIRQEGWTTILRDDGTLAYVCSDYVVMGPKPEEPLHPYYIYVEKGSFTINVYGLDANNEYTKLLHSWRTGVGSGSKTPTGIFQIGHKDRWHMYSNGACVPYASGYHGSLYIHGPVYSQADIYHMYNDQYREIGQAVTAGCLRTMSGAACWIYENCEEGTTVEIVNGSPRGTTSDDPPAIVTSHLDPTDPEA